MPHLPFKFCLSLADLALQLPEWPTVVTDLIEKFGKDPKTVPVLLEFLTVFPQEIVGNSKIKILNQWSTPEIAQLVPSTLAMYLGAQEDDSLFESAVDFIFDLIHETQEINKKNVSDLLERLDTFLLIIGRLEGDLLPDCLKSMGEIWTVISEILEQYGSSIKLSERISSHWLRLREGHCRL
ncbi:hypothetical protein PtB15_4B787 [Puccinia triticina]|nr:hypothetical protein PtB15_4B787 [Puccinia triticina]